MNFPYLALPHAQNLQPQTSGLVDQEYPLKNRPLCCRTSFTQGQILSQPQSTIYQFKNYSIPFAKQRNIVLRKTICGFLNNSGGIIYIGVEEDIQTRRHQVVGCYMNQYMKQEVLKVMRINFCSVQPDIVVNCKASIKFIPVKKSVYPFEFIAGRFVIKIKILQGIQDELYTYRTDQGQHFVGIRTQNQVLNLSVKNQPRKILALQKERARMVYLQCLISLGKNPAEFNKVPDLNYEQIDCINGKVHKYCRQPEEGFRIFESYKMKKKTENSQRATCSPQIQEKQKNKLDDAQAQKLEKICSKEQKKFYSPKNKKSSSQTTKFQVKLSKDDEKEVSSKKNQEKSPQKKEKYPKSRSQRRKEQKEKKKEEEMNKSKQNSKSKSKSKQKSLKSLKQSKSNRRSLNKKISQISQEQPNTSIANFSFGPVKNSNKKKTDFLNSLKGINRDNHQIYMFEGYQIETISKIVNESSVNHVSCQFQNTLFLYQFHQKVTEEQLGVIFKKVEEETLNLSANKPKLVIKLSKTISIKSYSKLPEIKQQTAKRVIIEIQSGPKPKKKETVQTFLEHQASNISTLNLNLNTNIIIGNQKQCPLEFGSLSVEMSNLARAFLAYLYLRKQNIDTIFA